jgi:hypothetical protein
MVFFNWPVYSFSLLTSLVSQLLSSIQREHPSSNTEPHPSASQHAECYFLDQEGVRISGATSIASLVMTKFRLRLNQKTIEVESRITGLGRRRFRKEGTEK